MINQHEKQDNHYLDTQRKNEICHLYYTCQGERSDLEVPHEQEEPLKGIVEVESSKNLLSSVFFSELESFTFDTSDINSAGYSDQESLIVHQDQETLKGGNAKIENFLHVDYECFYFGYMEISEKFPQHKT